MAWLAGMLAGCGPSVPPEPPVWATGAMRKVETWLTDPASAQYDSLQLIDGAVCGRVNAKNKMGGYVGFETFHVPKNGVAQLDVSKALDACRDDTDREHSARLARKPLNVEMWNPETGLIKIS